MGSGDQVHAALAMPPVFNCDRRFKTDLTHRVRNRLEVGRRDLPPFILMNLDDTHRYRYNARIGHAAPLRWARSTSTVTLEGLRRYSNSARRRRASGLISKFGGCVE